MLLQGELRPKWKRECLESGWSGDQPLTFWKLPKAHGLPNMVIGLDLQIRQLPSLQDMRSALMFRSPNMVILGGVSSTFMLQPIGKSPDPWRNHGKFHNPLPQFYVAGEYYSSVLEYFSGQNIKY